MNDSYPDYKALLKRCAGIFRWGHIVEGAYGNRLLESIPGMLARQYEMLRDSAYQNSADIALIADVLGCECTKAGSENRLTAEIIAKIHELKEYARQNGVDA